MKAKTLNHIKIRVIDSQSQICVLDTVLQTMFLIAAVEGQNNQTAEMELPCGLTLQLSILPKQK